MFESILEIVGDFLTDIVSTMGNFETASLAKKILFAICSILIVGIILFIAINKR